MTDISGSNQIRLIVTDMDGTLLNERGEVSEENATALLAAQSNGIIVAVATGRSYEEAVHPLKAAGVNCPIICVNGAEIRDQKGNILKSVPLAHSLFVQIEQVLRESDLYFELYTNEGTYTNDRDKAIRVMADYIRSAFPDTSEATIVEAAERRLVEGEILYVEDYMSVLNQPGVEIYKLLTFSRSHERLSEAASKLAVVKDLAVCSSAKNNLEITNIQAQKGIAVRELAAKHDIPLEQVMALGDNFNDLSMLTIVGRSVAMGNAVDEVKQVCSFVARNHDKHGVAHAIEEFVLVNTGSNE